MKLFSKSIGARTIGLAFKFLLLIFFIFPNAFALAQTNSNVTITNYTDVSPGVVGTLTVATESVSPELGTVTITGNLKYEFPPQPQSITFTLKNFDGKGSFKDFTISGTSNSPDAINATFSNVPLDKSSKTSTLATRDRFLITSKVDKGVDFFFPGDKTYLTFNTFIEPKKDDPSTKKDTSTKDPGTTIVVPDGKAYTQSIVVTGSKLISAGTIKARAKATVDFAALTLLPTSHYTPIYISLAQLDDQEKVVDYKISEWKEIEDPDAPRYDSMVLGASKYSLNVEKGKTYTFKVWGASTPNSKINEGEYLGMFIINADYLFGKKVTNTAPGIRGVDQKTLDDIWSSITGTFNPGEIEFFKVSTGEIVGTGSDDAYIFLSKIPGLANTKKLGADKATYYEAFDPTVDGAFSKYISIFINMIYGFIALLAVINIIRYGLSLMVTSATPFAIKENKSMIWNSGVALLIALGSYLLLNTINPNLTSWNILTEKISVPGEAVDFKAALEQELVENPTAVTDLSKYVLEGTFENPKPSNAGVKTCADKLNAGEKVTKIEVTAVAPNSPDNKLAVYTKDGLCASVLANIGYKGTTTWPISALKKTPKGANGPDKGGKSVTEKSRTRLPKSNLEPAICSGAGGKKFNCGAAFIETGITNENGQLRFIGIHGQGNNKVGTSAGCIKIKNDDLVLLAKHLVGVDIYIK